ncbi:hypothetical protein [Paraburkholderia sp. BCC1886]|uniref:hypothetical protein n=1 Tax=Paraburkholderia sp. BCC1886 TaxID=2562670 RepID=UPI001182BF9E|nr:hypothetical protein [Paraburkholderia sp. BCC1886]
MSEQDFENEELYPEITPPAKAAPQTIEVEVLPSDDHVLSYTQRQRQLLITTMMGEKGEKLSELDKGEKMVVLHALDGMDRQAISKKRLDTDKEISASQAEVAGIIAQVLAGTVGRSPGAVGGRKDVPQLPTNIAEPEFVPGEISVDAPQMDVDTFMAQSYDQGLSQ